MLGNLCIGTSKVCNESDIKINLSNYLYMIRTNAITKQYAKNARFLEYNSNVIPTNSGQLPLSIGLENLSTFRFELIHFFLLKLTFMLENSQRQSPET